MTHTHTHTHSAEVPQVESVGFPSHNEGLPISKQLARADIVVPETVQDVQWFLEGDRVLTGTCCLEVPDLDTPLEGREEEKQNVEEGEKRQRRK